MILFFWTGGGGIGGIGGIGGVVGLASMALMLILPNLILQLHRYLPGDDQAGTASDADTASDAGTAYGLTGTTSFYSMLLLQIILPMIFLGVFIAAITDDRVRRFFRLAPLTDEASPGQDARRGPTAATAAKIRSLPLVEYKTRYDLEKMPLKALVDYRNETRQKGYRAINTSTGRKKSDLLQSRDDVIKELVGDESEDDVCSICFAQYESSDLLRVVPCGHVFHAECGDLWFVRKATCPLCKAPI